MHSINFTENNKFYLSLHYNGANSYLIVNGIGIIKFKAEDSEINPIPLCLGNVSKDFSADNMKKTGLNGYVYNFSVNYDAIAVHDILDIHKYTMEKNNIKCLGLLKNVFTAMFFGCNVLNVNPLKCVSMNNQECKIRSETINANSNQPSFYSYSIKVNKCSEL